MPYHTLDNLTCIIVRIEQAYDFLTYSDELLEYRLIPRYRQMRPVSGESTCMLKLIRWRM